MIPAYQFAFAVTRFKEFKSNTDTDGHFMLKVAWPDSARMALPYTGGAKSFVWLPALIMASVMMFAWYVDRKRKDLPLRMAGAVGATSLSAAFGTMINAHIDRIRPTVTRIVDEIHELLQRWFR
ncbi:LPXTG cell wall anchor domain-containing protein [Bifidobacterium aquikefiricola]|uniref:LPXTG cell wall anchor domain-containing protein n=1 Tax=Bifidobacterium aquikefiricola TaxID=3059038 RepID=A0AB39U8Q8_9BIFI